MHILTPKNLKLKILYDLAGKVQGENQYGLFDLPNSELLLRNSTIYSYSNNICVKNNPIKLLFLVEKAIASLICGEIESFGKCFNEIWAIERSFGTYYNIDMFYAVARINGAIGGRPISDTKFFLVVPEEKKIKLCQVLDLFCQKTQVKN